MKKFTYFIVGIVVAVYAVTLFGMNDPILDCKNFDHLIANNAAFLRSLVAIEQGGRYCPQLFFAIETLAKNKNTVFSDQVLVDRCDADTIEFVRLIARRRPALASLLKALDRCRPNKILTVLQKNRYAANAYSLPVKYGGITTPLHYALWRYVGNSAAQQDSINQGIEHLLAFGAAVNAVDYSGNVPLHRASTIRHIELLCEQGADKNHQNNKGKTPLMKLIKKEDKADVALFLIGRGADVSIKDVAGNTALFFAMSARNVELTNLLEERARQNQQA